MKTKSYSSENEGLKHKYTKEFIYNKIKNRNRIEFVDLNNKNHIIYYNQAKLEYRLSQNNNEYPSFIFDMALLKYDSIVAVIEVISASYNTRHKKALAFRRGDELWQNKLVKT